MVHGCSLSVTVNFHVQPTSPAHLAALRNEARRILGLMVDNAGVVDGGTVYARTSISSIAFEVGRRHGKFHVHFQWDILSSERVRLSGLNSRIKAFFDRNNVFGASVYANADVDDHSSNLLRYHAKKNQDYDNDD